ncbi:MAG TPA: Ppx/GppA family phosphatase [Pseudobdellovibrionaceae bacterium]|nr:Ppx/GppA family phosphatase [Pseudobdellovibrionaceae bacterium]
MKVATLDLGTNTFLCLISKCEKGLAPQIISDESEVVRLGQAVNQSKEFHPEALIRAKNCLIKFKEKIKAEGVTKVIAGTTSAARDVKNLEEFLKIGIELDIPIQLISGKEEAELTYRGAFYNLQQSGKYLVVDVGGGSTEIIYGDSKEIQWSTSLQMGGVRFTEKFVSAQPILENEEEALVYEIQNQLLKSSFLKDKTIDVIVAVAGTPSALAALALGKFESEKVHGYKIERTQLEYWQKKFKESSVEEIKLKYNLGGRADIIFVGTTILLETLKFFNKSELIVSTGGVRYGLLLKFNQEFFK